MLHGLVFSLLQQESIEVDTGSQAVVVIISAVVSLALLVAMWRIYAKAGQPGWAVIIPIVNIYYLLKVAGKPGWWLLLLLVPVVNVIVLLIVDFNLAKVFGRSTLFGLGLVLLSPIFLLILGFGGSKYIGAGA